MGISNFIIASHGHIFTKQCPHKVVMQQNEDLLCIYFSAMTSLAVIGSYLNDGLLVCTCHVSSTSTLTNPKGGHSISLLGETHRCPYTSDLVTIPLQVDSLQSSNWLITLVSSENCQLLKHKCYTLVATHASQKGKKSDR